MKVGQKPSPSEALTLPCCARHLDGVLGEVLSYIYVRLPTSTSVYLEHLECSRTSRAGELRSAPSGPGDWHRVAGKRALALRVSPAYQVFP